METPPLPADLSDADPQAAEGEVDFDTLTQMEKSNGVSDTESGSQSDGYATEATHDGDGTEATHDSGGSSSLEIEEEEVEEMNALYDIDEAGSATIEKHIKADFVLLCAVENYAFKEINDLGELYCAELKETGIRLGMRKHDRESLTYYESRAITFAQEPDRYESLRDKFRTAAKALYRRGRIVQRFMERDSVREELHDRAAKLDPVGAENIYIKWMSLVCSQFTSETGWTSEMSEQEQALLIEKSYLINNGGKIKACLHIILAEYQDLIDRAEAENSRDDPDNDKAADNGGVTVRESASEVQMQAGEQGRPPSVQAEPEEGQQEQMMEGQERGEKEEGQQGQMVEGQERGEQEEPQQDEGIEPAQCGKESETGKETEMQGKSKERPPTAQPQRPATNAQRKTTARPANLPPKHGKPLHKQTTARPANLPTSKPKSKKKVKIVSVVVPSRQVNDLSWVQVREEDEEEDEDEGEHRGDDVTEQAEAGKEQETEGDGAQNKDGREDEQDDDESTGSRTHLSKSTKNLIDEAYKSYREAVRNIANDAGKDVKACLEYAEVRSKPQRKYNRFNSWKAWYAANGKHKIAPGRKYSIYSSSNDF